MCGVLLVFYRKKVLSMLFLGENNSGVTDSTYVLDTYDQKLFTYVSWE